MLPIKTGAIRSRAINDFISVGFDVRTLASGTFGSATPRTAVDLDVANAFVEARLIDQVLSLYIDETLGPGRAIAREAFGLVQWRPLNGYAKVGKFLLPYGLRLQDDAEFIRDRTGFNYNTPDQGVELGIEPGPLAVAVTNGSQGGAENDDGKQVTSSASGVSSHFRLGASASRNESSGNARNVLGGCGGFRAGPLTVLGEFDYILDSFSSSPDVDQLVAYVEGDLLATQGVNAKVTYGYHNRNLNVPEDQHVRVRFGLEVHVHF